MSVWWTQVSHHYSMGYHKQPNQEHHDRVVPNKNCFPCKIKEDLKAYQSKKMSSLVSSSSPPIFSPFAKQPLLLLQTFLPLIFVPRVQWNLISRSLLMSTLIMLTSTTAASTLMIENLLQLILPLILLHPLRLVLGKLAYRHSLLWDPRRRRRKRGSKSRIIIIPEELQPQILTPWQLW